MKHVGTRSRRSLETTRASISLLFDRDSFVETQGGADSSVLTGRGRIAGRKVYLISDTPYADVPADFAALHGKKMSLVQEVEADPHPLVVFADAFRVYPEHGSFIATPGFPEFL